MLMFENMSLVEPERRRSAVLLDIRKLPGRTADELVACRLKLVDVQGYVTHVPVRGGERILVDAQAMVEASR